jgi:hypothetical protein
MENWGDMMACLLTAYDIEPANDTCLRMIRDCMVQILLMQKEGKPLPKSELNNATPIDFHIFFVAFVVHRWPIYDVLICGVGEGKAFSNAPISGFAASIYVSNHHLWNVG